jgi:cell wall-associated NlpC family hydrolase
MDWTAYIGIPFQWHGRDLTGVDCYGLLCLVFAARGIALPDYWYGDTPNLTPLFGEGLRESVWRQVESPAAFDAVLFSISGLPLHCGVMVDPARFLHSRQGINSCIQRVDGMAWRNRVLGFYRYAHP